MKNTQNDNTNVIEIDRDAIAAAVRDDTAALDEALLFGTGSNGTPFVKNAQKNYTAFLTHHPDWVGVFAYDAFDQQNILTAPIPGSPEDTGQPFKPRPFEDDDTTFVVQWLDEFSGMPGGISGAKADAAMSAAAKMAKGDRLTQYLEECADKWDGVRRIEYFFRDYIVASEWNAYTKAMGSVAMMGQVLRGLYPGAKLKMMPILEGEQSIGKSPSLEALCPEPDMFGDSPPSKLNEKEMGQYLRGKFLVELAEMAAVRKSEQSELKAFVTRGTEEYRAAYARHVVREPRRCMIWGTINEDTYLYDETGATRYYPIEVEVTHPKKIAADRDQLLGEAVIALRDALKAGENWWLLPPKAQVYLDKLREEKQDDDPYTSVVVNYIEGLKEVTTREIVVTGTHATPPGLGLDNRVGRGPGLQVAGVLKKLGWRRKGIRSHGEFKGQAVYVAPKPKRK
jgi:Virulence-associated protein E-like domain